MDLYVERQYIAQMKEGNLKQFMMLFEAYFADLYRYVARRLGAGEETSEIVRLTFLDALGQVQNTPEEGNYLIWLYSLAYNRVVERTKQPNFSFPPALVMAITSEADLDEEKRALISRFESVAGKLSLEEQEIMRLKFFEEVTDGDVMAIMGIDEGSIGSKIYRVLKRIHFLLFGESDERQGVYFGELTGFLSRVRDLENIQIPEAFRLSLKTDLQARIDRRDFAIEAQEASPPETPEFVQQPKGSNDPAKIFVEAVKEMREQEELDRVRDQQKLERREVFFDTLDRWKHVLIGIPVLIFVVVAGYLTFKYLDLQGIFDQKAAKIARGYPTVCDIQVGFQGDFSDGEIRSINKGISDRICGYFDVEVIVITRKDDGKVNVFVDIPDWFLRYRFAKKDDEWRIKQYARTVDRYQKYREV